MDKHISLSPKKEVDEQPAQPHVSVFERRQLSKRQEPKNGRAFLSPKPTIESVSRLNTFKRTAMGFLGTPRANPTTKVVKRETTSVV